MIFAGGSSQRGAAQAMHPGALAMGYEHKPDSVEGMQRNAGGENLGACVWGEKILLVDFSTFETQEQNCCTKHELQNSPRELLYPAPEG